MIYPNDSLCLHITSLDQNPRKDSGRPIVGSRTCHCSLCSEKTCLGEMLSTEGELHVWGSIAIIFTSLPLCHYQWIILRCPCNPVILKTNSSPTQQYCFFSSSNIIIWVWSCSRAAISAPAVVFPIYRRLASRETPGRLAMKVAFQIIFPVNKGRALQPFSLTNPLQRSSKVLVREEESKWGMERGCLLEVEPVLLISKTSRIPERQILPFFTPQGCAHSCFIQTQVPHSNAMFIS